MKGTKLQGMTEDQLVDFFIALALAQDKALLRNEYAKFNRLFDEMEAVEQELKGRLGDQRHALLRLYEHPNAQVRLKAVKATLAVAPVAGRRMLKIIAESREYPQAGEAGMSILNLDRGIFKPT
jgi:ParB-like chromosome segregation protein Spo0J